MMKHRFRRTSIVLLGIALFALSFTTCTDRPQALFHPDIDAEIIRLAGLPEKDIPKFIDGLDKADLIAEFYRDPATKEATLAFFAGLTGSELVARVVLDNAELQGVAPALAFALAYEESRFSVSAFNDNGSSVDRGLFQLNSKSFPKLGVKEVYDPEVNAKHGIAHLAWCLETAGNEVAALAMYNAGMTRVSKQGTPKKTLDYVFRILSYERNITSLFAARVVARERGRAAFAPRKPAEAERAGRSAD